MKFTEENCLVKLYAVCSSIYKWEDWAKNLKMENPNFVIF